MPIIGLTDRGAQFPRIGELRKGAPKPVTGNKPGADLKHFRFTSTNPEVMQSFATSFGNEPTALRIFLPYATTDENFEAWIEEWGAGSLKWRGDGQTLHMWQTAEGAFSQEPKPQPKTGGKQVGRLKVIIPELGRLAYVVALTTSTHDILELTANLRAYEATRGNLQGIPFILSRVPRMVSTPNKTGRVRREKWLLHIEAAPEWVAAQIATMQQAALPQVHQSLMIGDDAPDEFDVDDDGVIFDNEYPVSLEMSQPSQLKDAIDSSLSKMTPEQQREGLDWNKPKEETKGHDMTPPNAENVAMWREKVATQHRLKVLTVAGMVANAVPYFDNDYHVMNYTEYDKDQTFMEPETALGEFDRLVAIGTEKANA